MNPNEWRIIHHGNNNYKRRHSTCGNRVDPSDAVEVERVNCVACIEKLLKAKYPTRKTEKWKQRLVDLEFQKKLDESRT